MGYTNKEILSFLKQVHNVDISNRTLNRILKSLMLRRKMGKLPLTRVIAALQVELKQSGQHSGYRAMKSRMRMLYGINESSESIRQLLKCIDPEGVEARTKRRFCRRKYISKGPNYTWHLDGYDKLKPYGFCIHGCIDGYSRKILWLRVSSTNNDPGVISTYYLDFVESIKGTARRIRADCGTENLNIAGVQRFFRRTATDSFAGEKSFQFGTSTANQRIEAYWSKLRISHAQFWINYFKDLIDDGTFDNTDIVHGSCLRFCFMALIQKELDTVKELHNAHRIRYVRNQEVPNGKPNILYNIPEMHGSLDYKCMLSQNEIDQARKNVAKEPLDFGCAADFVELAIRIMVRESLNIPKTPEDALNLFVSLIQHIDNL